MLNGRYSWCFHGYKHFCIKVDFLLCFCTYPANYKCFCILSSKVDELQSKQKDRNGVWALVEVDLKKIATESKRINISLPGSILSKIDTFAEKTNETRSGLLSKAALEYIAKYD